MCPKQQEWNLQQERAAAVITQIAFFNLKTKNLICKKLAHFTCRMFSPSGRLYLPIICAPHRKNVWLFLLTSFHKISFPKNPFPEMYYRDYDNECVSFQWQHELKRWNVYCKSIPFNETNDITFRFGGFA